MIVDIIEININELMIEKAEKNFFFIYLLLFF